MANLRTLLTFGIGLLVFAETVQATPESSSLSGKSDSIVVQAPATTSFLDEKIGRGMNSTVYERLRKEVLAWQAVPQNHNLCGTEQLNKIRQFHVELVWGGKGNKVKTSSMVGWNVAVLTATGQRCTGTLVSNRHITLAASCVQDITHAANLTVLFNVLSISEPESYRKSNAWNIFGVKAVAQHPLHTPDVWQQDNIALLELEKDVPLGGVARIRPACILRNLSSVLMDNITLAEDCFMTSYEEEQTNPYYSAGENNSAILSNTQMLPPPGMPSLIFHTLRQFQPQELCKKVFPMFQQERQVCAEGWEGYMGEMMKCPGRVGAGLLCKVHTDEDSKPQQTKWYLVGVLSYLERSCDSLAVYQNMWTGFAADNSSSARY